MMAGLKKRKGISQSVVAVLLLIAVWQAIPGSAQTAENVMINGGDAPGVDASLAIDADSPSVAAKSTSFLRTERNLSGGTCTYTSCDFSTLLPNVLVERTNQQEELLAACGLTVRTDPGVDVNVFDSFNGIPINKKGKPSGSPKNDPDLGGELESRTPCPCCVTTATTLISFILSCFALSLSPESSL